MQCAVRALIKTSLLKYWDLFMNLIQMFSPLFNILCQIESSQQNKLIKFLFGAVSQYLGNFFKCKDMYWKIRLYLKMSPIKKKEQEKHNQSS